jgi:hypothetical protein
MHRLAPVLLVLAAAGCSGAAATSPTAPTAAATFVMSGRIVDASALIPLAGVTVTAADGSNAGKSATTAADGRYLLENLVAGSFTLRARRDGYDDHLQPVTVTAHTTIDLKLIPGRSVSSGWSQGTFYARADGQQIGARLTSITVSQNGSTMTGSFGAADGSSGTFSGTLTNGRFSGSIRAELVYGVPSQRCRGTVSGVSGTASGSQIVMSGATMALENCAGTVTNVDLTITP